MTPHLQDVLGPCGKDEPAQQAQPSVAEDGNPVVRLYLHLLEDAADRGERLDEDGGIVVDAVRHDTKILDRQGEVLGEAAVAAGNAKDGAAGVVVLRQAAIAPTGSRTRHLPRRGRGYLTALPLREAG
ncbi:MAG: hypothetical protein GVY16_00045 [Planctomycetes bacterium]|jgi:hypothetical protein|nr:hypothetical protein [Phycisphaerae bacterium]NBB94114.1 hypothetical protein [Planctomycetota bacterium]